MVALSFYTIDLASRYLPRNFANTAPPTRFPAAAEPYSLAALEAILEKFLPGLPMSLPAEAAFAEYDFVPFAIGQLLFIHPSIRRRVLRRVFYPQPSEAGRGRVSLGIALFQTPTALFGLRAGILPT